MHPDRKVDFEIDFLDHVAIRVKDLEVSARWYEEVLGLKRYELTQWKPFPLFLLAGKTGVALFPAQSGGRFLLEYYFLLGLKCTQPWACSGWMFPPLVCNMTPSSAGVISPAM